MASPPTGTVTFLFTDIVGSRAMWERSPLAMRASLARHDEILRWATDYDAHRQAQIQIAEDEAFARVAGEIAEKEAISVERMRVEMANFVDDVGPEVRQRIREMLTDEERELSLTSLVQLQRVVLDTMKLLDRGEVNEEPPGLTDEEWEKLLGEEPFEEDA